MTELNTLQGNLSDKAREFLLASLLIHEDEAVRFDGGQYMDWSCTDDDGRVAFECRDEEGDVAQLRLTRSDIESLQRALTLYLLNT